MRERVGERESWREGAWERGSVGEREGGKKRKRKGREEREKVRNIVASLVQLHFLLKHLLHTKIFSRCVHLFETTESQRERCTLTECFSEVSHLLVKVQV